MVGLAHVEDRDHDLDPTCHGCGTEEKEDPLLVATELAQLRDDLVKLHLEMLGLRVASSRLLIFGFPLCWFQLSFIHWWSLTDPGRDGE